MCGRLPGSRGRGVGNLKLGTKEKKNKSLFLRLAVIAFGVYILYALVSFQVDITKKRAELAAVKEEYNRQQIENEELQRTLDTYGTNDFIESMARDKLGYAYSDEHFYVDVSGTN